VQVKVGVGADGAGETGVYSSARQLDRTADIAGPGMAGPRRRTGGGVQLCGFGLGSFAGMLPRATDRGA